MKVLITGICGQDGSYLAEQLLERGDEVHGLVRRSSSINTERIDHIFDRLHLHYADLTDGARLAALLNWIHPNEIYNLGAQSHVRVSFEMPIYTFDVAATGTLRLLEAVRAVNGEREIKFYQACSSEMFGSNSRPDGRQDEQTSFCPQSPYACGKVAAYHLARNYRDAYGMHICCGILFNHESPRRGETFVTRKIAKAVARIATGKQDVLRLGMLNPMRDWGYAPEYTQAMQLMLKQQCPADYVIATGEQHSVGEFVDAAFEVVGMSGWSSYCRGRELVIFDSKYSRPTEVFSLCGDASRAKQNLGWEPKVKFRELVEIMVQAELDKCST